MIISILNTCKLAIVKLLAYIHRIAGDFKSLTYFPFPDKIQAAF